MSKDAGSRTQVSLFNFAAIVRAQRISGLLFLIFLFLHLSNTVMAVFGPSAYENFQAKARHLYQHPLYELLLVFLPLVVHVACGIWRVARKGAGHDAARRMHRYTGVLLMILVVGHVLATRAPSLLIDVFPGFAGIAYTFRLAPAYFYPYYALFAAAAIFHLSYGIYLMLFKLLSRKPTLILWGKAASVTAWLFIVLSLLAFGGVLFAIDDPAESAYAQMIQEFIK